MDASLNFVELVENNPITRLNNNYNNKFINKIKENFTETQQHLFVSSFYCYLNYNQTTDYIVDLDNIWRWLGFSQKAMAKRSLEKYFTIDKDYKVLLSRSAEQTNEGRGGHNKEIIMLNIRTFKLFCIKAGTEKANEIHEYFVKLEELLQEIVQEENNELKQQLENHKLSTELEKELLREKTLIEQFPVNTQCVYYGFIDNKSDNNEKLIKFGNSNDLSYRIECHKKTYTNFRLVNAFKVENKTFIENAIKNDFELKSYRRTIEINKVKRTELLAIDNLSFEKLDKIIKEIIERIEYSQENYEKILLENKKLREENAKLKRENRNGYLLEENKKLKKIKEEYNNFMKTTFRKISEENNRIKMEYENLLKNRRDFINIEDTQKMPDETTREEQNQLANKRSKREKNNVDENNRVRLRKFQKQTDGYYYIDGEKYKKLFGNRQEVWEKSAYKTSGGLIRSEFIMNKCGEIVSKVKSEQSAKDVRRICKKTI
jgi:DVNP family/T5orf172 domain